MNSTVSYLNIQQTLEEKVTPSESLSTVSNTDDISSITWSEESYPEIISYTLDYHTEQTSKNIESTIKSDKKNTNKRIKIIIISVIILLILTAIAIIVPLIIILKSQNPRTPITTANANSYSRTTISISGPIIYKVGSGGAVRGDPPCSSHTVVNDPSRNIATSGIAGTCDDGPLFNTSINGRWIRFMGIGGTIMPLISPGRNHCGGYLSGWFNGSLPSTIGTIVSADMKILIIGGYGTFGSRLSRLLANQSQLTLLIAGRSIKHAQNFCQGLNNNLATILPLYFDRNDSQIENRLQSIQPDLVVDATGPFQSYGNDPYRVVKACLTKSINYLDLADGSQFVKYIAQFNNQAKEKNIYILSGVSSCPVLTAAVVRRLSKGLTTIHSIKGGIAPSPYAEIGPNVIRAIASYSGQQMPLVRNGQSTVGYALTETMRYTISPPGYLPLNNRRFSLVDVPDHQILRDLWPNIDSIWIGAGPIPEILHRLLNSLAWLVRWRLISSLSPFTSLFYRVLNVVRWGEHRGGMFVSIEGIDKQGQKIERSWHLLAEGDAGPFIPSMGIAAIVHRILEGKKPISGARAATTDIELEDYERLFEKHTIVTGQRESKTINDTELTLYQKLLDQAWYKLPQSLQRMHAYKTVTKVAGFAKVERGTSIASHFIAMLFRFPQAGEEIPVQVVFHPKTNGELWTRTFAEKSFSSWQTEGHGRSDKLLNERFGPFTFGLALVLKSDKLHLVVRNWSFLGIPLPTFLVPNGDAYEYDDNGRFCFNVEIKHLFTGLIVRYNGWLEPVP